MQNWIAGAMAVLGTLLVVGGGVVIVLRAMAAVPAAPAQPTADDSTAVLPRRARSGPGGRLVQAVRSMPEADRLIGWGIVLLLLGAVAAGAISVNFGASAGTNN